MTDISIAATDTVPEPVTIPKSPKVLPAKSAAAKPAAVPAKPAPVPAKKTAAIGQARYHDDDVITVLVDNPKKPGSATFSRFPLYGKKGSTITVGDALKAGVTRLDISWDADPKRNFLKITRDGKPV